MIKKIGKELWLPFLKCCIGPEIFVILFWSLQSINSDHKLWNLMTNRKNVYKRDSPRYSIQSDYPSWEKKSQRVSGPKKCLPFSPYQNMETLAGSFYQNLVGFLFLRQNYFHIPDGFIRITDKMFSFANFWKKLGIEELLSNGLIF